MFHELQDAANEMQTAMTALGELGGSGGEDIKAAAARLREVADSHRALTAARLDRMVDENEGNVDRFAGQGLAEFEQLMRETREAMQSVDALTKSLERDPSRVIYVRRPRAWRFRHEDCRSSRPPPCSRPAASAG